MQLAYWQLLVYVFGQTGNRYLLGLVGDYCMDLIFIIGVKGKVQQSKFHCCTDFMGALISTLYSLYWCAHE
jgi:hypothetical protein